MYLEANAYRKPVIGTRTTGVPEAVEHGVSGLLVEPDDDRALADSLIRLLTDTEESRRLGEGGRRIENGFTWAHSAKALQSVIHSA